MERPIYKPIGSPVEELDTPALIVDADILNRNINRVHSFFEGSSALIRPSVGVHGCPALAHMQLSAPGTVGGISVETLGQAESFNSSGIKDISINGLIVTDQKITRLCALAQNSTVTVSVDSASNVQDISNSASALGVTVRVLVAVATRPDRLGIQPGNPAVELAKLICNSEGLEFQGFRTHEGTLQIDNLSGLSQDSMGWINQVLETRNLSESAGINVKTVSAGGTYNYEVAGNTDGVTEVTAGAYALMDAKYQGKRDGLEPACKVITTVTSFPEELKIITDGGNKAIGMDRGAPVCNEFPDAVIALSAEHGNVNLANPTSREVVIRDKLWFTPWDMGVTANLYDYMNVVRDGRLESVWDLPARGRYR
tara:strand:- start:20835 stop:21941 length:1107 start_codon:yes stop_codon:yes gene_type:complete